MKDYLSECFLADYSSGQLIWKTRPLHHFHDVRAQKILNARHAGRIAGTPGKDGYVRVLLGRKSYLIHRIIWTLAHGNIPNDMHIDHINHDRSDNSLGNLRIVSRKENLKNKSRSSRNSTGYSGITFRPDDGKYMVRISVNGKRYSAGCFSSLEEAVSVRNMELSKNNYHPNHGRNKNEI